MEDLDTRHLPGVICPHCRLNIHPTLLQYDRQFKKREVPSTFLQPHPFTALCIVLCPSKTCAKRFYMTLRGQMGIHGEMLDANAIAIWPPPDQKLDDRIPEDIREDYRQAYRCWMMELDRAASLILRRCLENACIKAGATEPTLEKMIDALKAANKIHPMNAVSAHKTRVIGNFTAHVIREITGDEIAKALILTEKILDDLFVTPELQKEIDATRPAGK